MGHRKIIFVNRFFYPDHSATSQILTDLAFDLCAGGAQVEVLTSRLRYEGGDDPLATSEVVGGVLVRRLWTSRFGRSSLLGRAFDYGTFYLSVFIALLRCAHKGSVVVLNTDPPLLSLFAVPAARLRRATVVNWLQDLFPEVAAAVGMPVMRGRLLRSMQAARDISLRAAAVNVTLGSRMRDYLLTRGISAAQLRVVPNWADGDAIQPLRREENGLRRKWGIEAKFVVAYSGNFGRAHELTAIVQAMELLSDREDIHFVFIGGGAQVPLLKQRVREAGLQDNASFHPYQPREYLTESLGVADVHLVSLNPTLEGLVVPSKFYGVAAAGRPTLFIGDLDGEIARVLEEWGCGYAVPSGDGRTLADKVRTLAADPILCTQMGINARKALDARFSRKLAVDEWRKILVKT